MAGEDREVNGRVWVLAMEVDALPREIEAGDIVVVGNREDAQLASIELGVSLLVISNRCDPSDAVLSRRPRARAPPWSARRWTPT